MQPSDAIKQQVAALLAPPAPACPYFASRIQKIADALTEIAASLIGPPPPPVVDETRE